MAPGEIAPPLGTSGLLWAALVCNACSPPAPRTGADPNTEASLANADMPSVGAPHAGGTGEEAARADGAGARDTGAPGRPTLCIETPGAAPRAAFDEPNQGCEVQLGNWEQVLARAQAKLSFGFGPECAEHELSSCAQACENDDLDACVSLVNARLRGAHVELRSPLDRVGLGCAQGEAEACNAVAHMWIHGLGGAQVDRARAFKYRKEACRLGLGAACAPLGHMYKNGGDGIEQDAERGYELVKQGCQMGSASACNDYGWSMVSDSWGKPRDPERALLLFTFSCMQGSSYGCGSLGEAFEKGWGIPIDHGRALAFWGLQCEHHKMPEACEAARRLKEAKRPEEEEP